MNEIMPFAAPVEGSRDCHAKWNKSDRGRQILHVIIYMWNLKKKWHKWTYLQNRNRFTDVKQTHGYQGAEAGAG